jgi:hypothetical protein
MKATGKDGMGDVTCGSTLATGATVTMRLIAVSSEWIAEPQAHPLQRVGF